MRAICSLALALAACDRPQPLVICHNANCATNDVTRDDTLEALAESFALTWDGRPVLDGMEWDTFWHRAGQQCLFAHDLNGDTSTPATVAAQAIADHLQATPVASWNGERFYVFIELKGFVGEAFTDAHTEAELELHADCALRALEVIVTGARLGGHRLTVGFVAGVPALHVALAGNARLAQFIGQPDIEVMLVGDIFGPYSSLVPELRDYTLPLGAVEYHPDYMTEQHYQTYRSLGIDLVQWSFITTTEALGAIQRWEPEYAITNEALLLRRWIAN